MDVVGTQLAALGDGQQRGLIREVRGGSGYGSQDSAVMLLPSPQPVRQLWVRWPRGKSMNPVEAILSTRWTTIFGLQ